MILCLVIHWISTWCLIETLRYSWVRTVALWLQVSYKSNADITVAWCHCNTLRMLPLWRLFVPGWRGATASVTVTWRNSSPFASKRRAHWALSPSPAGIIVDGTMYVGDVVVTSLLGGGGIDTGVLAPTIRHEPITSPQLAISYSGLWQRLTS